MGWRRSRPSRPARFAEDAQAQTNASGNNGQKKWRPSAKCAASLLPPHAFFPMSSSVAKVLVGNHKVTAPEALQVAFHGAVVVLDTAVLDKVGGLSACLVFGVLHGELVPHASCSGSCMAS